MNTQGWNDRDEDEYLEIVSDLQQQGYVQVGSNREFRPGTFVITQYTGNQNSFGNDVFYNIKCAHFD